MLTVNAKRLNSIDAEIYCQDVEHPYTQLRGMKTFPIMKDIRRNGEKSAYANKKRTKKVHSQAKVCSNFRKIAFQRLRLFITRCFVVFRLF